MELIVKHYSELTADELYELLRVRVQVFVVEQHCPYEEVDGRDKQAYHIWLRDETGIKAYLRVLDRGVSFEEVSIGRVLTTERGRGLGHKILDAGIAAAREKYGAETIRIEAQTYARKLYERHGFRQVGDEFLEDDIPHIPMLWTECKR